MENRNTTALTTREPEGALVGNERIAQARAMLQAATTDLQRLAVRDTGLAMKRAAEVLGLRDVVLDAAELIADAERLVVQNNPPGQGKRTDLVTADHEVPPALSRDNIRQMRRAHAHLKDKDYEQVKKDLRQRGEAVTRAALMAASERRRNTYQLPDGRRVRAHEALKMLPKFDSSELRRSLVENGWIEGSLPIILTTDGEELIDGRARLMACEELGITPPVRRLAATSNPMGSCLALNLTKGRRGETRTAEDRAKTVADVCGDVPENPAARRFLEAREQAGAVIKKVREYLYSAPDPATKAKRAMEIYKPMQEIALLEAETILDAERDLFQALESIEAERKQRGTTMPDQDGGETRNAGLGNA